MRKAFHGRADSRSDPRVASRASVRRPIDRGRLRTTITLLWGPSRQQVSEQEKSQVRQAYLGPQMRRTRSREASWVGVTWYQSKPRAKSRVGTHFGRDGGVRGETILCDPVRNSGDAFVVGIIGRVDKRLIGFDFVQ